MYIDVPDEELIRRLSGRWICQQAGHVYHEAVPPAARSRACATSTARRSIQRADDQPDTIRARLAGQLHAMHDVVDHYAGRGILRDINGRQPIDDVAADMTADVAAWTEAQA